MNKSRTISTDQLREMKQHLKDTMPDDQFEFMVEMTHKVGTLRAVHKTQSLDPQVCAEFLYEDKEQVLSVEEFKEIVTEKMTELIEEGLIDTELQDVSNEGLIIVLRQEAMFENE